MRRRIGGEMMNNNVPGIIVIVAVDRAVSAVMSMVKRCSHIHNLAVVIVEEEIVIVFAAIIRVVVVVVEAGRGPVEGAGATYPFDTVRRRLQMQSEKPQSEWVYKGTMHCFGKIAKEEGVPALFKGAGANALRTVGSALVLVLYGEIKAALTK